MTGAATPHARLRARRLARFSTALTARRSPEDLAPAQCHAAAVPCAALLADPSRRDEHGIENKRHTSKFFKRMYGKALSNVKNQTVKARLQSRFCPEMPPFHKLFTTAFFKNIGWTELIDAPVLSRNDNGIQNNSTDGILRKDTSSPYFKGLPCSSVSMSPTRKKRHDL